MLIGRMQSKRLHEIFDVLASVAQQKSYHPIQVRSPSGNKRVIQILNQQYRLDPPLFTGTCIGDTAHLNIVAVGCLDILEGNILDEPSLGDQDIELLLGKTFEFGLDGLEEHAERLFSSHH